MSSHRVSRRDVLRLGAIGTAVAMGRQVLVAPAHAHDAPLSDPAGPLWTLVVDIQGLKALSANVCSIAIDPLDLDVNQGPGKPLNGRIVIRANGTPQVRKDIQAWFRGAHSRKAPALRYVNILITHRDGGSRGYYFQGAYPCRFSAGDYTTGAESCLETIEIEVGHLEMA